MRQPKAGRNEPRAITRHRFELLDGRICDFPVGLIFIPLGKHAPVHGRMTAHNREVCDRLLWFGDGWGGAEFGELPRAVFGLDGAVVVDLTAGVSVVARPHEGLWQGDMMLE